MNELRRNTTNESLAKRAKELVKKWRSMVLPDTNGQQLQERKRPAKDITSTTTTSSSNNNKTTTTTVENSTSLLQATATNVPLAKRPRINGQAASEFDFSDNSNSSFKDVIGNCINKITWCTQK